MKKTKTKEFNISMAISNKYLMLFNWWIRDRKVVSHLTAPLPLSLSLSLFLSLSMSLTRLDFLGETVYESNEWLKA